jgi:pilus assembly protein Flp/PilA
MAQIESRRTGFFYTVVGARGSVYQLFMESMMSTVMSAVRNFVDDEDGVTAIEYGLIAALVGVAIVVAAKALGGQLSTTFETVVTKLQNV